MFQTIKLFKSFFLYPKKEVTECRSESNRNYSISELDETTVHIKPYLFLRYEETEAQRSQMTCPRSQGV